MGLRDGEGALLDRRHVKIARVYSCILMLNAPRAISSNREKLAHPYFFPVAKILDRRAAALTSLVVEEHNLRNDTSRNTKNRVGALQIRVFRWMPNGTGPRNRETGAVFAVHHTLLVRDDDL